MSGSPPTPSPAHQRGGEHAIQNFLKLIEHEQLPGGHFRVNEPSLQPEFVPAQFVPYVAIASYPDNRSNVKALYKALSWQGIKITLATDAISGHYVNIFSILLTIGQGQWIQHFVEHRLDDTLLPCRSASAPHGWPIVTQGKDAFWDEFKIEQWHFCPHHFEIKHFHTMACTPPAWTKYKA